MSQKVFSYSENISNQEQLTNSNLAESKVWQGIKLEQKNQLSEAIEYYRQAVELNPQSTVAHHILAIALKKQNNLVEADYHHCQALSLSKNNLREEAHNITDNLTEVNSLSELNCQSSNNQMQNNTSVSLITDSSTIVLPKLTAVAPGTYVENNQLEVAKIYLQQAKLYYAEAQWQESMNACQEALKICPDLPETYKIYGDSLQQMGKISEAMGYYAQAISKNPLLPEVYANIGSIHVKKSNWQEAIYYYQKALAINPKFAKVCLHLSRAWEKIGEDEQALNSLLHGLKLQPEILTVAQLLQLGNDLLAEGKIHLAIICYEGAIKVQPRAKEPYLKLIKALEQDGQWQKVTSCHQAIVKLQNESSQTDLNTQQASKKLRINQLLTSNNNFKCLPSSQSNINQVEKDSGLIKHQHRSDLEILVSQYLEKLKKQPNSYVIRLNLGNLFARQQKWQQAIANYQQAIQLKPDLVIAYLRLGKVYRIVGKTLEGAKLIYHAYNLQPEIATPEEHYKLGDFWLKQNQVQAAMSCYRRTLQFEPKFTAASTKLQSLIELETQQHRATQANSQILNQLPKQEKIAQYLQKAQQQPNSASVQVELGNLYFLAGQWQEAIAYYLKGIKLAPREAKYYINLGKAWSKSGDNIKANQAFYQGFSLEPEKVTAQNHLLLGNKLLEQRQMKSAIACYRCAVTLQPELVQIYWQLGKALQDMGEDQEAIDCYQQALKVDPKQAQSYFWLGNVYTQTKQWKAALECYQKAAQLEPNNADIQHNLGDALSQAEHWYDAAEAYRRAISFDSKNSWTYHNLGYALLQLKQWQSAAQYFTQAISLKADFVWSHYNLGEALTNLQQWDKALAAYESARKIDPDLSEVKVKISGILYQRSQHLQKEALSFCKSQITQSPDNIELYHQAISLEKKDKDPELYLGLGKALIKQGKIDEAISIFQIGLQLQPSNLELKTKLKEIIAIAKRVKT